MTNTTSVETGGLAPASPEAKAMIVEQPEKLEGLLETIHLINTVSERIGEDNSGDMGSGGSSGGQQGDDDDGTSWRDQAIANLPSPAIMQEQLHTFVVKEINTLRNEIKSSTKKVSKPGVAYRMNELYSRIRLLNGILHELLDASLDVVKRLYIRIFIDKQSVF